MRLLTPRNPLAFPGGNPGFDPTHIAAKNTLFSGIASGGVFINILSGKAGTAAGAPATKLLGGLGPAVSFTGSTDAYTFSGFPTNETTGTIGLMFFKTATENVHYLFSTTTSASSGYIAAIGAASSGSEKFDLAMGGVISETSGVVLALNTPYFLAVSYVNNTTANYLVLNLSTGQVFTATSVISGTAVAGNGTYAVGNRPSSSVSADGSIAAAMYSGQFMSMPQLLQWAQSPWDFWYPQTQRSLMFSGIGGSLTQNPLNATPSSDHPGIIKQPEFQLPNLMSGLLLPSSPPFLMPQAWL